MAKRMQANGHTETIEQRFDPPTHEEDPLLTLTEVGRQLGRHHSTIKQWCIDRLLIPVKMPNGLFAVRKSEVNRFLGGSAIQERVR